MYHIIIFLIVLFIYLHVYFQVSTNDEIEVLEIEQPTKDKFEKICNLKQPFIFNYNVNNKFDVKDTDTFLNIRNVNYRDENESLYIPLKYTEATKLFQKDEDGSYYSENNNDFLLETKNIKYIQDNDPFLMPPCSLIKHHDYLLGSKNSHTPLRFEINFRNFFHVISGSVEIRLIPPNYINNLYPIYDYENFEFYSKINPWKVEPQYLNDYNKVKSILLTAKEGQIINIPPYWWYSIKFKEQNTEIISFKYRTFMNYLAITPYMFMHYLQLQNIKQKTVKSYSDFVVEGVENEDNQKQDNQKQDNNKETCETNKETEGSTIN